MWTCGGVQKIVLPDLEKELSKCNQYGLEKRLQDMKSKSVNTCEKWVGGTCFQLWQVGNGVLLLSNFTRMQDLVELNKHAELNCDLEDGYSSHQENI